MTQFTHTTYPDTGHLTSGFTEVVTASAQPQVVFPLAIAALTLMAYLCFSEVHCA